MPHGAAKKKKSWIFRAGWGRTWDDGIQSAQFRAQKRKPREGKRVSHFAQLMGAESEPRSLSALVMSPDFIVFPFSHFILKNPNLPFKSGVDIGVLYKCLLLPGSVGSTGRERALVPDRAELVHGLCPFLCAPGQVTFLTNPLFSYLCGCRNLPLDCSEWKELKDASTWLKAIEGQWFLLLC